MRVRVGFWGRGGFGLGVGLRVRVRKGVAVGVGVGARVGVGAIGLAVEKKQLSSKRSTSPMKLTATELTMRSSVDSDMTRKRQPAIHTASSSSMSVMGTSAISQRRRRLEGRTWPGLGLGSGLG